MRYLSLAAFVALAFTSLAAAAHPFAADKITSLTNAEVKYRVAEKPYVVLKRGGVTAVIVNNEAVDVPECPGHKAGYNGVASLSRDKNGRNLFVPNYAGLNFEHIHDGTLRVNEEKFEPRAEPMELRIIDEHTVELYQKPTRLGKLESCGHYHILEDGAIEYTFECIPREKAFANGYIGLFWASYIHQPESKAIEFYAINNLGVNPTWSKVESPAHGVRATHSPEGRLPDLPHDAKFPLSLVFNRSGLSYAMPYYVGHAHNRAFIQFFRQRDHIWFAQSPSGGGEGNPAWDFQWFIPNYQVDEAYGFTMRAVLTPNDDLANFDFGKHMKALNPK